MMSECLLERGLGECPKQEGTRAHQLVALRLLGGENMNPTASKLTHLLGSASLLSLASAVGAQAQQMPPVVAQAEEIPETVLITGSLIRGAVAVGVPVTN